MQSVRNPIEYLPLKCRYDTTINRHILGWMEKLHKYGLAAVVGYFVFQWLTTHTLPGWGWLLTPTGLFVIAKQTLPFLLRPMYRATQPRLADRIFADTDGLRFLNSDGETVVRWTQIIDLYCRGSRYVVVTRLGEHDFLITLTDFDRLREVIPRLAVNVNYQGWRDSTVRRRLTNLADGRKSVQCYYHYRSFGNCAGLLGLTLAIFFLDGITCGPALLSWQAGSAVSNGETWLAGGGIGSLFMLFWLWGSYWRGGIRTDEEGITQHSLIGKRFVTWTQVRGFRWQGDADLSRGIIESLGGTIWFWKGIGDADRLADEIASHNITVH